MKENKVERDLMSPEEFEEYLVINRPKIFIASGKFRSMGRALKRGHIISNGLIIPKRPFNNRANSSNSKHNHSRSNNELKKKIY